LASGKGQQAPRQDRAPACACGGILQQLPVLKVFGKTLLEKRKAAQHCRQQVVEVVGDAGQLSEHIPLLRYEGLRRASIPLAHLRLGAPLKFLIAAAQLSGSIEDLLLEPGI